MAVSVDGVKRTKVPDGDGGRIRVYFDPEDGLPPMPSVSVIKGLRTDPEKDDALAGWRSRYDGQSNWGRPWWNDQREFKGHRGTLIHFAILSALGDASGDTYFHTVGDDDWGHEEYYSEYCLKKWSKKAPSANTDEVPYTPRENRYDGEHAWDKAVRGMKWATSAFKAEMMDTGRLTKDRVLEVEQFVYDEAYGYGGQYDLLYEDDEGKTILADVKTSSATRFDHKLQSAAYKHAVESTNEYVVDECEIIRLHPDSETVEISRSSEWDRTLRGLEHEFLALCDVAHQQKYSDVLKDARLKLLDSYEQTSQSELPESA